MALVVFFPVVSGVSHSQASRNWSLECSGIERKETSFLSDLDPSGACLRMYEDHQRGRVRIMTEFHSQEKSIRVSITRFYSWVKPGKKPVLPS